MIKFCDFSDIENVRQKMLGLLTDAGFYRQVADSKNDMYVHDGIEGCVAVTSSLVVMFCPGGNVSFRLVDIENVIIDDYTLEVSLRNKTCVLVKLKNTPKIQEG